MDRKITKTRLNIHLEYDWVKYIIIVAVAILIWWMVYSSAGSVAYPDRIDIMCLNTPGISDTMQDKVWADKDEMFGEGNAVEQINFNSQFANESNIYDFRQMFMLRAQTEDMLISDLAFFEESPTLFAYLLDFERIYTPPTDAEGNPKLDAEGNAIPGYWNDENGKAMLKRLDEWGALYRYHFDRAEWETKYTEALKDKYDTQEKLEAAVKEIVDDLEKTVEDYELEGKVFGILLNKVPGLENACFFRYAETTDENGEKVKTQYFLSIFVANMDKSTGGGNKGHFNGSKMDQTRAEAFDFIEYLFSYDEQNPEQLNAQRYTAL